MSGPLDGIRVLDLSHALAGPSATRLLASLGADVVKVEHHERGDFTRSLTPWVFEVFNRDKRSIALDLKHPDGKEVVGRLVAVSDVLVQAFRPGAMEAVGLGRDVLVSWNPRLVHVSFSGFGAERAGAGRRGVDPVIQAESGLALLQGGVLGGLSFVDQAAGLALANAVLAALFQRERTGRVEHVDANLLDTAIYLQSAPLLESSVTGNMLDQRKHASRYPMVGTYTAADGPLYVAGYRDPEWVAICEVLGHPELADDPRFATSAQRSAHAELIRELFTAGFATRPRAEWVAALEARRVLAGEVRNHAELLEFSQVAVNGSVERLELRDGREGAFARLPFRFAGRTPALSVAAPEVGAHTDEILELAGFPPQERDRLRRTGAVAGGVPTSAPS